MKKYILIFAIPILFFIGASNVFAEEVMINDRLTLIDSSGVSHPDNLIDDHPGTSTGFNGYVHYELDDVYDITKIQLHSETGSESERITFEFYDSNYDIIDEKKTFGPAYRVTRENFIVSYPGVKYVHVVVPTGPWANGFNLYSDIIVPDTEPPSEIADLTKDESSETVTLRWTLPQEDDFSHVNVYRDGELIESELKANNYTITNLVNGQSYEFKITAVDESGNESQGVTISATPKDAPDRDGDGIPDDEDAYPDDPENIPPPTNADELPEVKNLEIEATPERVDLSWKNPTRYFEKAKIYRRSTGQATASSFNLNPFAPITVQASEEFSPLFETNGTTFADLSVSEQESYEYKVTTVYDGMESQGVTVQTTVPKPPLVDTSDTKLPFDVGALIKSGNGLLGLIGGFVLLALAFIFVPKVIETIKQSFSGNKNGSSYQTADGKSARLTERQQKIATGQTREPRTGRVPRQGRI